RNILLMSPLRGFSFSYIFYSASQYSFDVATSWLFLFLHFFHSASHYSLDIATSWLFLYQINYLPIN
ncbi:MAG TPA: hypothetical protein PK041_01650, partial [Kaistella sp.]|nr:hypothetical protein [Kaistella sp.]